MIWILIFVVATSSGSQVGSAGITAEFNNKAACMNAASEVLKQSRKDSHVLTVLCAEKGLK